MSDLFKSSEFETEGSNPPKAEVSISEQIAELQKKVTDPSIKPQERVELIKKLAELKKQEQPAPTPMVQQQAPVLPVAEKKAVEKKEAVTQIVTIAAQPVVELSKEELKVIEGQVSYAVPQLFVEDADFENSIKSFEHTALQKFNEVQQKVIEIVVNCKSIKVTDAASNLRAKEVGKSANALVKAIDKKRLELTKPLRDEAERINSVAKQLSAPLETEVERFKIEITAFDLEQERIRQEQLKKAEEERKAKEEADRIERERIDKIKEQIRIVENAGLDEINRCDTVAKVDALANKLTNWKPKAEFYQEFLPQVQSAIADLIEKVKLRKPVVQEMENQKAEAERLAKIAAEQEAKAKEIEAARVKALEQQTKAEQDASNAQAAIAKAEQDRIKAEQAKAAAAEAQRKAEEQQQLLKKQQESAEADRIKAEQRKAELEEAQKQSLQTFLRAVGVRTIEETANYYIQKYGSAEIANTKKNDIIAEQTAKRQEKALGAKTKNLRTDYKFEITDESLIAREFLSVDEKKIREAIIANREALEAGSYTIAGIEIYADTKAVLR
jgi:hypothetical protein